jgi:RNA polymerase sporulation-specific sigma factor
VKEPLIGTPKQVQKKLDKMAIYIRRNPDDHYKNQILFETIHLYMHGFLINIALKQFPYIKGLQTVDIYQESLIALRFKAIPGFRMRKGMSFLNFAKMCIRRHLITILNSSKTRLKDQSMNQAVSLDSATYQDSDDGATLANTIPDGSDPVDKQTEMNEAYAVTLENLCKTLSIFEQQVLHEYLTSSSYNEIADDLSGNNKKANPTKSVDNALVRIRNKAQKLMEISKIEDIPLFQL